MKNKLLSVIKPLIATIPYAGGIATTLGDYEANIRHNKLEDFVRISISELETEQKNIKKEQKEIVEVLTYIAYFVARDPIPIKSKIYANCLVQYCTTEQDIETMINIVQLIENLLPEDIEVLRKLSSGNRIDDALNINENTKPEDISKYNLSIKKLESRGLIVHTKEDTSINSSTPMRRDYSKIGNGYPYTFFTQFYQPLHIGQELLKIWK